jgi:hypothetical protein
MFECSRVNCLNGIRFGRFLACGAPYHLDCENFPISGGKQAIASRNSHGQALTAFPDALSPACAARTNPREVAVSKTRPAAFLVIS